MKLGSELSRDGCYGIISNFGDYVIKVDQEDVDREFYDSWFDRSLEEEAEAQREAAAFGIAPKCYGVAEVELPCGNFSRGILMDKVYGCNIREFEPYESNFKITRRGQWLSAAQSILKIYWAWGDGCPSHGDLNPGNLMVTPSGKIYVIDWGREKTKEFEPYYQRKLLEHRDTINGASTWNHDPLVEVFSIANLIHQYENVKSGILC